MRRVGSSVCLSVFILKNEHYFSITIYVCLCLHSQQITNVRWSVSVWSSVLSVCVRAIIVQKKTHTQANEQINKQNSSVIVAFADQVRWWWRRRRRGRGCFVWRTAAAAAVTSDRLRIHVVVSGGGHQRRRKWRKWNNGTAGAEDAVSWQWRR